MSGKVEGEKVTVGVMVEMYCRGCHGGRELCCDCRELLDYALRRLDGCRWGEAKGSCRRCQVHCYAPAMAARMREVMRYSGPRMLLRHPVMAIRHLISEHSRGRITSGGSRGS